MAILLQYLQAKGVKLVKNQEVTRIETSGNAVTKVFTGTKEWAADNYIIARWFMVTVYSQTG